MRKKVLLLAILFFLPLPIFSAEDISFAKKNAGKILLQVEEHGEAWYVNPENLKRYFLGRPQDAFTVMREQGQGITNLDLNKILVGLGKISGRDSDEDGLSDDLEKALGLKINYNDSDGDGYNDYEEIVNGHNPNDEELVRINLHPFSWLEKNFTNSKIFTSTTFCFQPRN